MVIREKRPRLFNEAFDIQRNLLTLQIHRDISLILASADVDDLHLNVLFGDAGTDEIAHCRKVVAFYRGVGVVDAALLALLLIVESRMLSLSKAKRLPSSISRVALPMAS